jgi:hypothetical protein
VLPKRDDGAVSAGALVECYSSYVIGRVLRRRWKAKELPGAHDVQNGRTPIRLHQLDNDQSMDDEIDESVSIAGIYDWASAARNQDASCLNELDDAPSGQPEGL